MSFNNIHQLLKQQNISLDKLQTYLKSNNADEATVNQALSIFKNLDRNGDNQISLEEWATTDVDLKELDKNNDGHISDDEVQSASQYNLFKPYGSKVLNTVLSAMNNSGGAEKSPSPEALTGGGGTGNTQPEPLLAENEGSATADNSSEVSQNPQSKLDKSKYEFDKDGNLITYPKEGESFKKTAERLGFKPGSPEYDEFVKANPEAGKRNWFKVGDKVKVPPSLHDKVNEDGIIDNAQGKAEVNRYNELHPVQTTPTETAEIPNEANGQSNAVDKSKMPQAVQARIEQLKNSGDSYEISGDVKNGYNIKVTGGNYMDKNGIGVIEIQYDPAGNLKTYTQKYGNGKVTETTYQGGQKTVVKANPAPQKYQDIMAEVQKQQGGKARLEFNAETQKYELIQTDLKDENIKEIRTVIDSKSWQQKVSQTDAAVQGAKDAWNSFSITSPIASLKKAKDAALRNRDDNAKAEDYFLSNTVTYANGKVTQGTYVKGRMRKQTTLQDPTTKPPAPTTGSDAANSAIKVQDREKLNVATDISFNMPPDAPENAKTFASALTENKAKLMKELGIDSDTYNMLAQTAMGIAAQETNFGEKTLRQTAKDSARIGADSIAYVQDSLGIENKSYVKDWSHGVTQLKYTLHANDEWVKTHMENLGITNELQLEDPQTSAIATMVVLAKMNKEIDAQSYQEGIKTSQGTSVSYPGWEMGEDGIARKSKDGETTPWTNEISRQDVLCAFWNGAARAEVKNGTFKPQIWQYSRNVSKYTQQYKLEETPKAREEAVTKEENKSKPFKDMANNGEMGGIVFLPAMYSDKSKHMNSASEIKQLNQTLTEKGVDGNLRRQLVSALQNGELGFDFGLRQEEINSLTDSDIKMLLTHLKELKSKVNSDAAINTEDGINSTEAAKLRSDYGATVADAEDKFREEYLNSHSKVYSASDSNPKVLREKSTVENRNSYIGPNGLRKGFKHEKAKGVNVNTTNGRISKEAETLANAGHSVVSENPQNKSGLCLTGVKDAMKRAGIDVSDMTDYGNTPKYVQNWFAAHPEMFTPVEYVSNGDGTAREINASDIDNLPAGYIVLWMPEAGSKYGGEAGHIAITNGNGQGYADATDNLGWGGYSNHRAESGKGEHGKFVVYKLSDNWEVDPSTGKLKLTS